MTSREQALALVEELELQIRGLLIEGVQGMEIETVDDDDEEAADGLDLMLEVASIIAKLGRVRGILEADHTLG